MKFIKFIIAFIVIYIFFFIISTTLAVSLWLNTFTGDVAEDRTIVTVFPIVSEADKSASLVLWKHSSALSDIFTRSAAQPTAADSKVVALDSTSGSIDVVIYNLVPADSFRPLGLSRIIKVTKITVGETVHHYDVDGFADFFIINQEKFKFLFAEATVERVTINYSSDLSEYGIMLSDTGLTLYSK
jgi:hypothetical protein